MCIMIHSMQLVDQRPTRSPRRMPSDQRPRATRSAAALSSAQVRRWLVARSHGEAVGEAAGGAVEQVADGQLEQRTAGAGTVAQRSKDFVNGHMTG